MSVHVAPLPYPVGRDKSGPYDLLVLCSLKNFKSASGFIVLTTSLALNQPLRAMPIP